MRLIEKMAARLAATKFGASALTQYQDTAVFKTRPEGKFYIGIGLIVASYLMGLPGVVLLGWLGTEGLDPLLLAGLGAVLVVLVHLIFAAGVYLAGANYAKALVGWCLARFGEPKNPSGDRDPG